MRPITRPWAGLALGLALLGGPGCIYSLDPGAVACGPSGSCPAGYSCDHGRCYPFGELPASGAGGGSSGAATAGMSGGTAGGSSGGSSATGGGSTGRGSGGTLGSSGASSGGSAGGTTGGSGRGASGGTSSSTSGGPSGGTSGGNGNGAGNGYASTLPAVYDSTSQGQAGLLPGLDGGVSVGVFPTFSSDFFYVANGQDNTVSRIVTPSSGAPYEQARYPALVPIDNHGLEPPAGASGDAWQVANQYNDAPLDSPGATVIDRRGSAWVLLRAPAAQSGVTEIADMGDHLADCVPRCQQRLGLAAGQAFTEGVPLQIPGSAPITLSPPGVIAPGSAYATKYPCQDTGADSTGSVVTDPRNYDDCALLSIPLGDPNPDPFADPSGQTRGLSFARASAVAPDCDPVSGECDIWIGMWNGGAVIRLAYASPAATGAPFDVADVIDTGGANPFSATIDCSGLLWTSSVFGNLAAITTRPLLDLDAGLDVPARTLVTPQGGAPNGSQCGIYDIGADVSGRVWTSSFTTAPWACAFDTRVLLADEPGVLAGTLGATAFAADLQAAWTSYDLSAQWPGNDGHSLAVDVTGNVYVSSTGLDAAVAFNPDTPGPVPCLTAADAGCADGAFLWPMAASFGTAQTSAAIDVDPRGNVWLADVLGTAVEVDDSDGVVLNAIPIGNGGEVEPSDFTGRFSRTFAPSPGLYSQTFTGCANGAVDTSWGSVGYSARLPPGSDLSLAAIASSSPSGAGGTAIPLCQSVQLGNCDNGGACAPCGNPIPLPSLGVPASPYLTIVATLTPQVCGASPANAPVLFDLSVSGSCP